MIKLIIDKFIDELLINSIASLKVVSLSQFLKYVLVYKCTHPLYLCIHYIQQMGKYTPFFESKERPYVFFGKT